MNEQEQSNYLDLFHSSDKRKRDMWLKAAGEPKPKPDKKKNKTNKENKIESDPSGLNM